MVNIKKIYLYAVCLITMAVSIFAAIRLIDMVLNNWVFQGGSDYWSAADLSAPIAMLAVAAPLFYIHWRLARKEV